MNKMKPKVLWVEGILLSQQHFQAHDDFWQQQYQQLVFEREPYFWGVSILRVDEDLLREGVFRITKLTALLPQGVWIDYQCQDASQFLECRLTETIQDIYICHPKGHTVHNISGYPMDLNSESAYFAEYRELSDQYDSNRKKEVLVAKQNIVLHVNDELMDSHHVIRIAKIRKDDDGFCLDTSYIPPLLNLDASEFLKKQINQFLSRIKPFTQATFDRLKSFQNLYLQCALNRFNQLVLQLFISKKHRPYSLYLLFINLIAELEIIIGEAIDKALIYQHDDLFYTFSRLMDAIIALFDKLSVKNILFIGFCRETNHHVSDYIDVANLQDCEIILSVNKPYWQATFDDISKRIKIGTPKTIDAIIASSLAGIDYSLDTTCEELQKSDKSQFRIKTEGYVFNQLLKERVMVISIPGFDEDMVFQLLIKDKR